MAAIIATSNPNEKTKTTDSLYKPFATNDLNSIKKLIKCTSKEHITIKCNLKSTTVQFSPSAYLSTKKILFDMFEKELDSGIVRLRESFDQNGKAIDFCLHMIDNNKEYVVNMYSTTCTAMINGTHYKEFDKHLVELQQQISSSTHSLDKQNSVIATQLQDAKIAIQEAHCLNPSSTEDVLRKSLRSCHSREIFDPSARPSRTSSAQFNQADPVPSSNSNKVGLSVDAMPTYVLIHIL